MLFCTSFNRQSAVCFKPKWAIQLRILLVIFISLVLAILSFKSEADAFFGAVTDPNLRACIDKTSKRKDWSKLEDVTALKCHKMNIKNLQGIEIFVNLKSLSLFNNKISELDSDLFAKLSALKTLNLARNNLSSVKLADLPSLSKLYLFSSNISKLTLVALPELSLIKANGNKMEALSYKTLPKLSKIYIFDNELEHIDIYSLPSMTYMDARQNPMPDELYDEMDAIDGVTILHDGNADDW